MQTFALKDKQNMAFAALRGRDRAILNTPMGWGKSIVVNSLIADWLLEDDRRKAIITFPQKVIAKNFVRPMRLVLPTGEAVDWTVSNDLCSNIVGKLDRLVQFLQDDKPRSVADRIVTTTHLGLARALEEMDEEVRSIALRRTMLAIDEAHHVQVSDTSRNSLGRVVELAFECAARIVLATAFFFRGDRLTILPDDKYRSFEHYFVPFDEHFRDFQFVTSFGYDFVAYKGTVWRDIERLLRESQEPTIFYLPPDGHRLLAGQPKARFVARLKSIVDRYYDREVIDLVEFSGRSSKLHKTMHESEGVGAILTVGMFKEGADWPQAGRVIDLVPSQSDQDRNQRFGRLFRDVPGKSHVQYWSFLPVLIGPEEDQRREFTKLFAQHAASLVLENALTPLRVKMTDKLEECKKGKRPVGANPLADLDQEAQESIVHGSAEALLVLAGSNPAASANEAKAAIFGVLDRHGVDEKRDELATQIVALIHRRQRKSTLFNAAELVSNGFDKVWKDEIFDGLLTFTAGFGGPKTFEEVKDVFWSVFDRRWAENYSIVAAFPGPPETQSPYYMWVQNVKAFYRNGRLSPDRIVQCESIPWWTWAEGFEDRWNTCYVRIAAMERCPKSGTADYTWVRQQRRLFHQERLPDWKVTKLKEISWWSWASNESNWDSRFAEIAAEPMQPTSRTKDYEWVNTQRKSRRRGKLSKVRQQKLESISWWSW